MRTRIKSLREDSDLTQKDLSKYLNITQVAYSYYELNKRSIPLDLLSKLADFYHVSVDYLLYRTDIPYPYPKKPNNHLDLIIVSVQTQLILYSDYFCLSTQIHRTIFAHIEQCHNRR